MKVRSQVEQFTASAARLVESPALNLDGTLTAIILRSVMESGGARLITLALPPFDSSQLVSGRYFLARYGANSPLERAEMWSFAVRRPLLLATATLSWDEESDLNFTRCDLVLPHMSAYPGEEWLAAQPAGTALNLLGPFGQGFALQETTRNLLLVTNLAHLPALIALIDHILDRSGRVTLVLHDEPATADEVRGRLPLPVELRLASDETLWRHHLAETIRWADQIASALPNPAYPALADLISANRVRATAGFAQALVEADLVCGVGACLACAISLPEGGLTRACVHGPVFDLFVLCGKKGAGG